MTQKSETRITDADFAIAKSLFAENDDALKFLRKIFFPELSSANPIGVNFDLWSKVDLTGLSNEQKLVKIEAHQMLVTHVEACLSILKTIAGTKEETAEETKKKLQTNSSK